MDNTSENTGIKCKKCGFWNKNCINIFNIENPFGNHERLYLLQCERCKAFTLPIWEDDWTNKDEPEHWYYYGPYSDEKAEIIFLFFIACRKYKDCECEIHKAVYEWVVPGSIKREIFDRADLISKLKTDQHYVDWKKEWQRVILPVSPDQHESIV